MKTRHILLLALSLATTAAQAQMNIKISTGQIFRKDTIDHKVLTVQYETSTATRPSWPTLYWLPTWPTALPPS